MEKVKWQVGENILKGAKMFTHLYYLFSNRTEGKVITYYLNKNKKEEKDVFVKKSPQVRLPLLWHLIQLQRDLR